MDQVQFPVDLTIYEKQISVPWQPASLVTSVMSDSLWLYGPWPARLLCPWDSPGKNTGVGYHFPSPNLTWDSQNNQQTTSRIMQTSQSQYLPQELRTIHAFDFTYSLAFHSVSQCKLHVVLYGMRCPPSLACGFMWLKNCCCQSNLSYAGCPVFRESHNSRMRIPPSSLAINRRQWNMIAPSISVFFLLKKRTKDENEWNSDTIIIEE